MSETKNSDALPIRPKEWLQGANVEITVDESKIKADIAKALGFQTRGDLARFKNTEEMEAELINLEQKLNELASAVEEKFADLAKKLTELAQRPKQERLSEKSESPNFDITDMPLGALMTMQKNAKAKREQDRKAAEKLVKPIPRQQGIVIGESRGMIRLEGDEILQSDKFETLGDIPIGDIINNLRRREAAEFRRQCHETAFTWG